MAKEKKSNGTSGAASSSGFLDETRKKEILGIITVAIAVLLGISILTYSAEDYALISKSSFDSLINVDKGPALRIKNGLGPVGAYLAHFFVFHAFGYISLVIPSLVLAYGWSTFRNRDVRELTWNTVYSLLMMILVSTIIAWFAFVFEHGSDVWNGSSGRALAQILYGVMGPYGSAIILFVTLSIALLLLVDRDIQLTIDRIKEALAHFQAKLEASKQARLEEKTRKKAEALRKKEEAARLSEEQSKPQSVIPAKKLAPKPVVVHTPEPVAEQEIDLDEDVTIDQVLHESRKRDEEKYSKSMEEGQVDLLKNRAILEKPVSPEPAEDDVELKVFVGENEEQAEDRELEKQQRELEKEIPIIKYKFPTIELLDTPPDEGKEIDMEEINEKKRIILDKLKRHGIEIIAIDAIVGPTVTLYELTPAPDVKISKIESYANDLKMAMAALGLRIIAPIPGKSAVGIEVPNNKRETVFIKQVINTKKFVETKMDLPVAFGKTIENEVFMIDLTKTPHLLVAGATGSGKSVGVNTIITCLLYKCHPENLKFVLVDPKKIELALYRSIQKHYLAMLPNADEPIITDTSKVLETLTSVCKEMDDRYDLLKMAMVRDIKAYNEKFKNGLLETDLGHRHLPYIVVIIDELADLMMTAGKQVEEPIARIAQLARAVGIHLVVATQRPSVNVITGTIKANFPSRIAYQVASKIDSRTILDTMGADQLVGRGDMLYSGGGPMIRIQNAFVSTEEVERITAFIGNQLGYTQPYYLPMVENPEDETSAGPIDKSERDELFEEAAKVVVLHQQGSVSLLQRKLRLGYNRAGRLIDQLFSAGIVGPYQGSTAREVLVADEEELQQLLRELDEE